MRISARAADCAGTAVDTAPAFAARAGRPRAVSNVRSPRPCINAAANHREMRRSWLRQSPCWTVNPLPLSPSGLGCGRGHRGLIDLTRIGMTDVDGDVPRHARGAAESAPARFQTVGVGARCCATPSASRRMRCVVQAGVVLRVLTRARSHRRHSLMRPAAGPAAGAGHQSSRVATISAPGPERQEILGSCGEARARFSIRSGIGHVCCGPA